LTDERIERVARALAKAAHDLSEETDVEPVVSEHHRDLARIAVATLKRARAAQEPLSFNNSLRTEGSATASYGRGD
jgi:acyl-CoA reductase-like NAD-dependent aldehyde dehydrogenase